MHMPVAAREAVVTVKDVAFSTDQFERMIDAGILTDRDRAKVVADAEDAVRRGLSSDPRMPTHPVFQLSGACQPRSDIFVYRRTVGQSRLPTLTYILLVREITDSSPTVGRTAKLSRYGAAGMSDAWLFDLPQIPHRPNHHRRCRCRVRRTRGDR